MAAALPTTAIPVVTETHLAEVLDDHESDVTAKPRHSIAAVWAGVSGAVMVPAALSFAPELMLVPLVVLAGGLGYLGYLDSKTRTIKNQHTLVLALLAASVLVVVQVIAGWGNPVLIAAAAGAIVVFATLLGVALTGSNLGGGDIKLSPVPAAILTVVSPLAAVFWLMFSLVLSLIGMIFAKLAGTASTTKGLPMVPFMAVAAPAAVYTSWAISEAAGIYTGII